jgi:hypothetical protein
MVINNDMLSIHYFDKSTNKYKTKFTINTGWATEDIVVYDFARR